MAILRQLNEFVRESVVLALEPSRECICSCTYCFARINSSIQHAARSKSLKDDSTFEFTLEKAYSSSYDPTNFLQWGIRNKLILGWANTVEPFQDERQAISLLKTLNQFNIPIFLQTKGINFLECVSYLQQFHDNSSVFISIPSLDQRVAKRFEPGTPAIVDRLKMIEMLRDLGFWVIGALSPYHEEWNEDPEKIVNTLTDCGVNEIFFDRLHLNQRQYMSASDRVMAEMAGGRYRHWPPKAMDHLRIIYQTAISNELEFFANGFEACVHGYGNTLPTINPDHAFKRGLPWIYHDGLVFHELENNFYSEKDGINPANRDFQDSVIVTWDDVLMIMERNGGISQPFSYSSLMDIIPIYKRIPDSWKEQILGGKGTKGVAPMSEWFRCLWNNPYKHQFIWRHPWFRIACNMDGVPYVDETGNIIGIFDPDYTERYKRHFRKVESLEGFRELEYAHET
jgi:DNA repair photolyase